MILRVFISRSDCKIELRPFYSAVRLKKTKDFVGDQDKNLKTTKLSSSSYSFYMRFSGFSFCVT